MANSRLGFPEDARARIHLTYESTVPGESLSPTYVAASHGLLQVTVPTGSARRAGLTTDKYQKRPPRDYAEQDAKNGCPQVSLWPNNSVSIMTETQRPYS